MAHGASQQQQPWAVAPPAATACAAALPSSIARCVRCAPAGSAPRAPASAAWRWGAPLGPAACSAQSGRPLPASMRQQQQREQQQECVAEAAAEEAAAAAAAGEGAAQREVSRVHRRGLQAAGDSWQPSVPRGGWHPRRVHWQVCMHKLGLHGGGAGAHSKHQPTLCACRGPTRNRPPGGIPRARGIAAESRAAAPPLQEQAAAR